MKELIRIPAPMHVLKVRENVSEAWETEEDDLCIIGVREGG